MGSVAKAEAIVILNEGRRKIWELIAEMDEATLSKYPAIGEWSVADLVGHIATWEELALQTIQDWKARVDLTASKLIKSAGGVDGFNSRQIQSMRSLSGSQLVARSNRTFEALTRSMEDLTDQEWVEPSYFETDRPGEFGEILGRLMGGEAGLFRHIEDHIPDLEEFVDHESWHNYLVATLDKPPSPIFDRLASHLPTSGNAIDLGCGGGRGTRWLVERGLSVTAVDKSAEAIELVRERLPEGSPVELVHSSFQKLKMNSYDVVVAIYTLFFLRPAEFEEFWPRLVDAVRPGGVFAGEFLGPNDDWRDREYTLHARDEVHRLFEDFEVLDFVEEEEDGETAVGDRKHWHVFHVIARKRS